jgi:hypothetical protein
MGLLYELCQRRRFLVRPLLDLLEPIGQAVLICGQSCRQGLNQALHVAGGFGLQPATDTRQAAGKASPKLRGQIAWLGVRANQQLLVIWVI